MGLDMYLRAEKYVSGYEFSPYNEKGEYTGLVAQFGVEKFVDPETPSATVQFTVAYWRKANHIHQWFVDNVMGGVDACRDHYVSREQLQELRQECLRVLASTELVDDMVQTGTIYSAEHPKGAVQFEPGKVLKDPTIANELLPRQEGFFFGGMDYDQWYWRDLEDTVKQIDRALAMPDEWTFEYYPSW